MEILDTISTVDSLAGTVIGLVKSLVLEVNQAQNDVTNLPAEVENLQKQYEKLSDRVTQVQEANAKLLKVHADNPKMGEDQSKDGELECLLKRLESALQSDLLQLESLKKDEEEPRSKKVRLALIGKGAASLQKQIQEILRRIEVDCEQLDEAITIRSFAGAVRIEGGVGRLEASVGRAELKVDQAMEGIVQVEADVVRVASGVDQVRMKLQTGFIDVKEMLTERLPIIQNPQSSGAFAQVLPEYPVAMKERASSLEETVSSLKDGEVVGIFGMGGIGKTTLAKQVFNNICGKFVYTCFVDEVKGIQPRELEKGILEKFQQTEGTASCRSWTHLIDKKTLIVMDDIDCHEQLASVLSRRRDFGRGSVVMFTTRNSHLCKRPYIVSFEVPFLNLDDARTLLCKHAFDQEDIPQRLQAEMSKYVKEVVNKCDGLPLSLEVIGRHLYGEDAKIWEGTILKLSRAQGVDGAQKDSLFETLKVSYDALAEEEQQMFLDIATFFVGERLDVALAAMSISCVDPGSCWRNLVKRCLVKEEKQTDSDLARVDLASHFKIEKGHLEFEYQQVWMHEHLQDLGKKLAKNSFLSGEYTAANKIIEEINSYKEEGETKQLRIISISNPSHETALQISSLAKVTELEYLRLHDCRHEGPSQEFPRDLALLQWTCDYGDDFSSSLHDMKNLAVLEFEDRSGKDDSDEFTACPFQLPDNFGGLTKLKILRLSCVVGMIELKSLSQSFGKLLSLEILVLEGVYVTHLPESFGDLSSIKTLVFKRCSKLTHLPDSFGDLSGIQTIVLESCYELTHLPVSFGNLSSLRSLVIVCCSKLMQLPPTFSNLSGLRILYWDTELVEFCWDSFQNIHVLQNLQVLRLELLNANPPPSFSHLSSKTLQYLKLTLRHEVPEGDVDNVRWDLSSLEGLTTQGKELTGMSNDLGRRVSGDQVDLEFKVEKSSAGTSHQILAMKSIQIWRQRGVQSLSQMPGVLLQELQTFPKSMGKLSLLEELEIGGDGLTQVPDNIAGLSSLKALRVRSTCHLKTLPKSIGQLGSLKDLTISGCSKLKTLPESFKHLGSLEELTISKCGELLTLPEGIGQLGSLKNLKIKDCNKLKTLPQSLGQLGSLVKLSVQSCDEFLKLPESMGNIISLKKVCIAGCPKLKAVPHNWGKVTSPTDQASVSSPSPSRRTKLTLYVWDCPSLMDFVRTLQWDLIKKTGQVHIWSWST